jgi:hypothetical protein
LSDAVVVRPGGQRRADRNEWVISVAEIGRENRPWLCIGVWRDIGGVEPGRLGLVPAAPWDCQGRAVLVTG